MNLFDGSRRRASLCRTRPVTPEVAGSSPVAPVENTPQIGIFCCPFWRNRPPALRPVTRSSRTRIRTRFGRMKTLQIGMFWGAGTGQGFR